MSLQFHQAGRVLLLGLVSFQCFGRKCHQPILHSTWLFAGSLFTLETWFSFRLVGGPSGEGVIWPGT